MTMPLDVKLPRGIKNVTEIKSIYEGAVNAFIEKEMESILHALEDAAMGMSNSIEHDVIFSYEGTEAYKMGDEMEKTLLKKLGSVLSQEGLKVEIKGSEVFCTEETPKRKFTYKITLPD